MDEINGGEEEDTGNGVLEILIFQIRVLNKWCIGEEEDDWFSQLASMQAFFKGGDHLRV